VLRNTGTQSLLATPRLRPAQGNENDFIDLGGTSLAPGEIKSVTLDSISAGTQGRSDFDKVSIEVMNSGDKGSLIAALNGVDESTGLTYDVPLRDIGNLRNSTGAYPWRLDRDVSTIVSITNVTSVPTDFVVQINFPGGPYLLDPHKLAPGATATYDLRKIRDQQIPDRAGHTIPTSVNGGQFRWFIRFGGRLIGRAEMLSVSSGISSSYSCGTPCPPHYDHGEMNPDDTEVIISDSTGQAVVEYDVDSYNNQYGPYSASVVSAWSGDTDIATYDGATVGGVSMGETGTAAQVEYPLYVNWEGDCDLYGTNYDYVNGSVAVKGASILCHRLDAYNISTGDCEYKAIVGCAAHVSCPNSGIVLARSSGGQCPLYAQEIRKYSKDGNGVVFCDSGGIARFSDTPCNSCFDLEAR